MKFLFIGPGFPGVKGASHGSGIGTYLREITLGLTERGHECHVIVWSNEDSRFRIQDSNPDQRDDSITQPLPAQDIGGVKVILLCHSYWPLIERMMPDSRDVWRVRRLVKQLDAKYHYDWIEIQSEEGIGIGVQRDFPNKTILRAHTTLLQMVEYKGERKQSIDPRPQAVYLCATPGVKFLPPLIGRKLLYRLRRERRSFQIAKRIVTHSKVHAEEIKRLYPGVVEPVVVWHGIGKSVARTNDASVVTGVPSGSTNKGRPTFLLIGTIDRRKGFDRIRPVLEAYKAKYGFCRAVIVAGRGSVESLYATGTSAYGGDLMPQSAGLIDIEWKSGLSSEDLSIEYAHATVYLHLARYESFGVPLIEAACHGLPIVSTRVGIAEELLSGDLETCLVNGDDSCAIAETLHRAVENRVLMEKKVYLRYTNSFTRECMTVTFLAGL